MYTHIKRQMAYRGRGKKDDIDFIYTQPATPTDDGNDDNEGESN